MARNGAKMNEAEENMNERLCNKNRPTGIAVLHTSPGVVKKNLPQFNYSCR